MNDMTAINEVQTVNEWSFPVETVNLSAIKEGDYNACRYATIDGSRHYESRYQSNAWCSWL